MKNEIRNAIREGIKESELNGYKWTITADGLEWSYGESFEFIEEEHDDIILLFVIAKSSDMKMARLLIGKDWFCDCSDIVDAYRIATKATINNANRTY